MMAQGPRRQRKTIERAIHFYRINTGLDEGGAPLPLDLGPILDHVAERPFSPSDQGGRYLSQPDGDDHCLWVDAKDNSQIEGLTPRRLRLGRLRRSAFPQAEAAGRLSPVRLAADASLCEVTHMTLLPRNLVGVEFNFFAPRPTRLADYIHRVADLPATMFTLEPLLRSDVVEELDQQSGLRLFDLLVRPSYAEAVRQASTSLGDALVAARSVGDAAQVGVILKADPKIHADRLGGGIFQAARALARRSDLRENAARMQVRAVGAEGTVHTLDLLADQLVTTRRVAAINARSRAVESEAAYAAIRSAYEELNEDGMLDRSPSVGLQP